MRVSVHGADLHYGTRGEGPVCLVLTGIGTKFYERQMPARPSDVLKLAFVDLRGSGQSTGDPTNVTFDTLANDLDAVRLHLGVQRVAVLGHSILGALAIEYGRRRPLNSSHVIVVGTPPKGDMARLSAQATSFFDKDATEERKRILRDNLAALPPDATSLSRLYAQTPMRFFDARFDAAPLFAEADDKPALLRHFMGKLMPTWDITADAESLRTPILLAHGRYDYAVPYVLWDEVMSKLPTATMRLFERSGHQPFFEEPDRFVAAVTEWMAGYPGTQQ